MTNFHIPAPTNAPSLAAQEAREKRRQVLARAAATRKANYQRFMQRQRAISNRDAGEREI
jgi:hypothetical protein